MLLTHSGLTSNNREEEKQKETFDVIQTEYIAKTQTSINSAPINVRLSSLTHPNVILNLHNFLLRNTKEMF